MSELRFFEEALYELRNVILSISPESPESSAAGSFLDAVAREKRIVLEEPDALSVS